MYNLALIRPEYRLTLFWNCIKTKFQSSIIPILYRIYTVPHLKLTIKEINGFPTE